MSELREQIKQEIGRAFSWHSGVTFDEATDRILALFDKLDPQDCPTCRAIIEATLRELDTQEREAGREECAQAGAAESKQSHLTPMPQRRAGSSPANPREPYELGEHREHEWNSADYYCDACGAFAVGAPKSCPGGTDE